jgi:hypothetical protein
VNAVGDENQERAIAQEIPLRVPGARIIRSHVPTTKNRATAATSFLYKLRDIMECECKGARVLVIITHNRGRTVMAESMKNELNLFCGQS